MRDWWTCGAVYRNWNTEKLVALASLEIRALCENNFEVRCDKVKG